MRATVRIVAAICMLAGASVARADSIELALRLGDLVGSEEICGYDVDQGKLEALINKRVRADDMEFASTMAVNASLMPNTYAEMAKSMKTAHCVQMRRLVKALGLTP